MRIGVASCASNINLPNYVTVVGFESLATAKKYQTPGWVSGAFGGGCGIRFHYGVAAVQPAASDSPLGCHIEVGSNPSQQEKHQIPKWAAGALAEDEGFDSAKEKNLPW